LFTGNSGALVQSCSQASLSLGIESKLKQNNRGRHICLYEVVKRKDGAMLNAENLQVRPKTRIMNNEKLLKKILVVSQEDHQRLLLATLLTEEGHSVLSCSSDVEALKLIQDGSINFIIIDHFAPELDGLRLLEKIKQRTTRVPVLIISAQYDVDPYITAMNLGALDYFGKPIDYADIQRIVNTYNGPYSQTKRKYNVVLDEEY
jgi:CheY-like chemotaxis protein